MRWHAGLCISRKAGTGGSGWGHPQGGVHVAVARLGCKGAIVVTEWANSRPGCMNMLRKCNSHPLGDFIFGREGLLGSEQVYDYREF